MEPVVPAVRIRRRDPSQHGEPRLGVRREIARRARARTSGVVSFPTKSLRKKVSRAPGSTPSIHAASASRPAVLMRVQLLVGLRRLHDRAALDEAALREPRQRRVAGRSVPATRRGRSPFRRASRGRTRSARPRWRGGRAPPLRLSSASGRACVRRRAHAHASTPSWTSPTWTMPGGRPDRRLALLVLAAPQDEAADDEQQHLDEGDRDAVQHRCAERAPSARSRA